MTDEPEQPPRAIASSVHVALLVVQVAFASLAVDFNIAESVDFTQLVQARIPKRFFTDEFAVTSVRQNRTFIRDVGGFRMRRYYEDVIRPLEVGVTFNYRFDVQ